MTGGPRRCALPGCNLRIDQMDESGHRRLFCSPAHRTARRKQRLAERLETLRRIPPGELPPALNLLPAPALVRTPVRFVPAPTPTPPGPWNPAAAWVITESSPLQPPVSSRSRPAPRRTDGTRDADPGAGRRVMASAALAGVLAGGAGYVLLEPVSPATDRAPLPPGTERPSTDAEQHVVRAEVVLAALDRQLEAVQRTEADLRSIPAARRGRDTPAAVRALLARKSILEQQRAAVQSQLGALRELPLLTAELNAAQAELDAIDRQLRQSSTIGVSASRSLAESSPQARLELRRQQLDQNVRALIDRRIGAQQALAAPLPDPADRTAPVVANVQRLLAFPALGTSGRLEPANEPVAGPVDGSLVAGFHSSAAPGYGIPVVAGVRGSALEGAGSPIVIGVANPAVTDVRDPAIALGGSPTAADFRSPPAVDGGVPASVDFRGPATVDGGAPRVVGSGSPGLVDGGTPAAAETPGLGAAGGGIPVGSGNGNPVVLGSDSSLPPSVRPVVPGVDSARIDDPVGAGGGPLVGSDPRPPLIPLGSEPSELATPAPVRPLDELLAPRRNTPVPAVSEPTDAAEAGTADRNDRSSAPTLPSPADRPSDQFFPAGFAPDPAPIQASEDPQRSRPVGKAERVRTQLGLDAPTANPAPPAPESVSAEQNTRRPVGKAERARQIAQRGDGESARGDDRATDQDDRDRNEADSVGNADGIRPSDTDRERAGQDSAERDSADQNSAGQDSGERDRVSQDSADQNSAERDRLDQDKADQDSAERDSPERDRAGQDEVGSDGSDQDTPDRESAAVRDSANKRIDVQNPTDRRAGGDRSTSNNTGRKVEAGQPDNEQNDNAQGSAGVRPDAVLAVTDSAADADSPDPTTSARRSDDAAARPANDESTGGRHRLQRTDDGDTDDRQAESAPTDSRRTADSDQSSDSDQRGEPKDRDTANSGTKDSGAKDSSTNGSNPKNSDAEGSDTNSADAEATSSGDGATADHR